MDAVKEKVSSTYKTVRDLLSAINGTAQYFPEDQERLDELAKLYRQVEAYGKGIRDDNTIEINHYLKQCRAYLVKLMPDELSSDMQAQVILASCENDLQKVSAAPASPYQYRYRIIIEGSIEADSRKGVFGMVERMYKACGGNIRSIKVFQ